MLAIKGLSCLPDLNSEKIGLRCGTYPAMRGVGLSAPNTAERGVGKTGDEIARAGFDFPVGRRMLPLYLESERV
jgi:hypothetical protein